MKYRYEDLSPEQFEELVILICQKLFGISVQGFAKGPDGGKDAKFDGAAEQFPDTSSPWKGVTIIQAKHTNGYNKSYSEKDCFSEDSQNTVIGKEILKIQKLKLENYILFSNRRLSGVAEENIKKNISDLCNLEGHNIYICGLEQLELWLKTFDDIPQKANLDLVDSPLIVSSNDLAEVIEALASNRKETNDASETFPVDRVSYAEKNEYNNMTKEYAEALKKQFLKETNTIRNFLAAPENSEHLESYENIVTEFKFKIIANRKDHQTFDKIMEHILDVLFNRDPVLKQKKHKRLTRAMLFYMYWNCDIGTNDA